MSRPIARTGIPALVMRVQKGPKASVSAEQERRFVTMVPGAGVKASCFHPLKSAIVWIMIAMASLMTVLIVVPNARMAKAVLATLAQQGPKVSVSADKERKLAKAVRGPVV